MNLMFYYASSLSELNVDKWDTSNVIDMSYMFSSTNSLGVLDLSKWNTSKVTNMSCMFYSASSLSSLNISNWNTSRSKAMSGMLRYAYSLKTLILGEKSKLTSTINLPENINDPYTGEWQHKESETIFSSSKDFIEN